MTDDPLDPQAYRTRAEQLRQRAQSATSDEDRAQFEALAKMFDELAGKVETIAAVLRDSK